MSLSTLAKTKCSNFFNGDCCLSSRPCLVLDGIPCKYFSDVVWRESNPAYRFACTLPDYTKNAKEFNTLYGKGKIASVRHCACGAVLAKRRKMCDACAVKNRRAAYRASKAKKTG